MSTKMTLPMAAMPSAISESVTAVLKVHGLSLSSELLRELGNNCTMSLSALDETFDVERPATSELLSVGETLRSLARAGRPNADAALALARVGAWLSALARAELDAQRMQRTRDLEAAAVPVPL